MKFKCDTLSLRTLLNDFKGICKDKIERPLQAFIKLEILDNTLIVKGSDDPKIYLEASMEVSDSENGSASVNCLILLQLLSTLDGELEFELKSWMEVRNGRDTYSLAVVTDHEVHKPTEPKEWTGAEWLEGLDKVAFCSSSDELQRFSICGINIKQGEKTHLIATDSIKVGIAEYDISGGADITIQGGKELASIKPDECEIGITKRHVHFRWSGRLMSLATISTPFPDISGAFLDTAHVTLLGIKKQDLLSALKRSEVLGSDILILNVDKDVRCSLKENDFGKADFKLECEIDGESIRIGYDVATFKSILNRCPDTFDFVIQGPFSGSTISFDNVKYLIMPKRIH